MKSFEYLALDPRGRRRGGTIDGQSAGHARQRLREQGLVPVEMKEIGERHAAAAAIFGARVGAGRLALATQLLATLLRSGMPMDEALAAVARQTDSRPLAQALLGVRTRVTEGRALAEALGEYPRIFPPVYRSTVAAGEQTRHLDVVLSRLAEHAEQADALRGRLRVAMIYPAVLVITALAVVAALLSYVVPQVVEVFAHAGRELPLVTRALIAASAIFRQWWWAGFIALAAGVWLARRALAAPAAQAARDRLLLRLPVAGRLIRDANAARFTRALAVLLASGVSMLDALRIAAESVTSRPMRAAIERALERVREGESLNAALGREPSWPALTSHLIANGEHSGRLAEMLDTAAAVHERGVQTLLAVLMGLLEPALIFAMGGMVLFIVVAILLPIFDLNRIV